MRSTLHASGQSSVVSCQKTRQPTINANPLIEYRTRTHITHASRQFPVVSRQKGKPLAFLKTDHWHL